MKISDIGHAFVTGGVFVGAWLCIELVLVLLDLLRVLVVDGDLGGAWLCWSRLLVVK